jgi:hypothetical protein
VGFFDRLLIPFKTSAGIVFHKINELKTLIGEGKINKEEILLNTLVSDKAELKNSFEIKAINSFIGKYWASK